MMNSSLTEPSLCLEALKSVSKELMTCSPYPAMAVKALNPASCSRPFPLPELCQLRLSDHQMEWFPTLRVPLLWACTPLPFLALFTNELSEPVRPPVPDIRAAVGVSGARRRLRLFWESTNSGPPKLPLHWSSLGKPDKELAAFPALLVTPLGQPLKHRKSLRARVDPFWDS